MIKTELINPALAKFEKRNKKLGRERTFQSEIIVPGIPLTFVRDKIVPVLPIDRRPIVCLESGPKGSALQDTMVKGKYYMVA